MEKKDWTIKNIPVSTVNAIKQRAVDCGGTIPQILSLEFGAVEKVKRGGSWLLYNISGDTKEKIMGGAISRKETIEEFLEYLLDCKTKAEEKEEKEDQIKKNLIKKVKHALK